MIKVIGMQRVVGVFVLAISLVGIFLYNTYKITPEIRQDKIELSKNQTAVSEMTQNMEKLVQGMQEFAEHRDKFELVQINGFFDTQDRLETRKRIIGMIEEAGLLPSEYSVGTLGEEENELAAEAGYKILSTELTFKLRAFDDADIYNFIHLLDYGFPGQISIERLKITRTADITQAYLRKVSNGEDAPAVEASMNVNWRTMVPLTAMDGDNKQDMQGGAEQ